MSGILDVKGLAVARRDPSHFIFDFLGVIGELFMEALPFAGVTCKFLLKEEHVVLMSGLLRFLFAFSSFDLFH